MSEHNTKKLIVARITVDFTNGQAAELDLSRVVILDRQTKTPLFSSPLDQESDEVPQPAPADPETVVHDLDAETTQTLQTMLRARGVIEDNVKLAPQLYRNGDWSGLKADVSGGPGFGALEAEAPVDAETLKNIQEGVDNATN